jgi:hypothetical protein
MKGAWGEEQGLLRAALFVVAATFALAALPIAAQGTQTAPNARAAGTLHGTDTAHLRYLHSSGSVLVEEGTVAGGVSGRMHATLNVGATFTGSFTFYLQGGTISGHGTAVPHGSGRYESFSGTMAVTHGTGKYAHIKGHGGMFGTFDRKTYDVVIQTTGTLHY